MNVSLLRNVEQRWTYNFLFHIRLCFRLFVTFALSLVLIPLPVQAATHDQPHAQQDSYVSGKITDATSGEPLPGVNVIIKGSTHGVSTDISGDYKIKVERTSDILVFSFIGFKTVEIPSNGKTLIDVNLESDVKELSEVVVHAGYYDTKDKDKTGAIFSVNNAVIERQPVSNMLQALQGRVPGLYVEQAGGTPGNNFKVNIRGVGSIQNGTDPLYIVDGVPFISQTLTDVNAITGLYGSSGASPLSYLNPNDIESIQVLKDADATAIYGSRGANGVILINTKKGKAGKTKLSVQFSTGYSEVAKKMDLMDTQQYLEMRRAAFTNENAIPEYYDYDVNGSWDTTRYTNWQEELIGGKAEYVNAQATISGGKDDMSYVCSGTYQRQSTVFPGNSNFNRAALHFGLANQTLNDRFGVSFTSDYVISWSDAVALDFTSKAISLAPNAPALYDSVGGLNWENSAWENPLAGLVNRGVGNNHNFIGNAITSYKILRNVSFETRFGLNTIRNNDRLLYPSTYYDPAFGIGPESSFVVVNEGRNTTLICEPQLKWNFTLGSKNKFSTLLGLSIQNQKREMISTLYQGFSTNVLMDDPRSATFSDVYGFDKSEYRYAAIFGRINYTFNENLILNLTGRRDGSSRFGPGKQYANLGAIGAAWLFFRDNAVSKKNILSFGKLRSSYGITGNDQIGDYNYLDTYTSAFGYQGVTGIVPTRLFNQKYAWETTKKIEVASELGFLQDRIQLTIAYFINRSSNQLVNYPTSGTTGFGSILRNLPAKIQNSGLEISGNAIVINKAIRWELDFNLTFQRSKLISFPDIKSSSYDSRFQVGRSLSIAKTYKYERVDAESGLFVFSDLDGDASITPLDRLNVIDLTPKYYGGINNTMRYKNISLDVFFQFVNKTAPGKQANFGVLPGAGTNQPADIYGRDWRPDKTNVEIQRFATYSNSAATTSYNRYLSSDAIYVDGSFIRLKNISLTYALPLKRSIECRLFIQGQNLLTLTKYDGIDPENAAITLVPPLRTVTLGCNLTL